jgi:ProP effector
MTMTRDEKAAALALLAGTFPKRRRKPLNVGIHIDLQAALDGAVTPREVRAALRHYTGKAGYLSGSRTGAQRIDLDGNVAGIVTANEEEHSQRRLAGMAAAKARRAQERTQQQAAEEAPQPRRAGLADLRAAAQRRTVGAAA